MTFACTAISWTKYFMLSLLFVAGGEYMYIEALRLNLDKAVVSIIVLVFIALSNIIGALFFRESRYKEAVVSGAIILLYGLLRFAQKHFVIAMVTLAIPAVIMLVMFFYLIWRRRDTTERKGWQCFKFSAVTALGAALVLNLVPSLIGFNTHEEYDSKTNWAKYTQNFVEGQMLEKTSLGEYSEVMKCLNNWSFAEDEAKEECIRQIAIIEMKTLGIEDVSKVRVTVEAIRETTLGVYIDENGEIKINIAHLRESDVEECLKTVLHEVFHAYEFYLLDTLDFNSEQVKNGYYFRQAREWKNNVDAGYVPPAAGYESYLNQPLERDANKYAEERFPAYKEAMKEA